MTFRFSIFHAALLSVAIVSAVPAFAQDVDFGDDSSQWARDGECDDPRFEGPGMSADPVDADLMADASDCRKAFDGGLVTYAGGGDAPASGGKPAQNQQAGADDAIDFGEDTGTWINDGECDDPRFEGLGMSESPVDADLFADASDCRNLYDAGIITLAEGGDGMADGNMDAGAIDFGTDSGEWTNDGECDDPRFVGEGMAEVLVDADLMADATDCQTLYDAGMITLAEGGDGMADDGMDAGSIDFGTDSGEWTNDGECDDPRFVGEGMSEVLVEAEVMADATDCQTLYDAGMIMIAGE